MHTAKCFFPCRRSFISFVFQDFSPKQSFKSLQLVKHSLAENLSKQYFGELAETKPKYNVRKPKRNSWSWVSTSLGYALSFHKCSYVVTLSSNPFLLCDNSLPYLEYCKALLLQWLSFQQNTLDLDSVPVASGSENDYLLID